MKKITFKVAHNCKKYTRFFFPVILYTSISIKLLYAQHFSSPLPQIKVTSHFGYRIHPIHKVTKFHYGVDLLARADTVKSILHGSVIETGYDKKLGYYLKSRHGEIEILYAHLSFIYPLPNDSVSAGDHIGISGSTGNSRGEHLHLSVKIQGKHIDPLKFLKAIYHQFTNH